MTGSYSTSFNHDQDMPAPKLFISYSWTSPAHEEWVLHLATELRQAGVDVVLDKWDLREGHDAAAFMERMVADDDVKKVALICDKAYAKKADARSGGVGTEAQIVSAEIYRKQEQDKFVAVVTERDDEGRPYLPTYYSSRIFIDLSDGSTYGENYDILLRWIFDKPLHIKPDLGKPPAFLEGSEADVVLATPQYARRVTEALRNRPDRALPFLREYLERFAEEMERMRLMPGDGPEFIDAVIASIAEFEPYRNELNEVVDGAALYGSGDGFGEALHAFFERAMTYFERPGGNGSWQEHHADNYHFIVHEMFLYTVATLLKRHKWAWAKMLWERPYYIQARSEYSQDRLADYTCFRRHIRTLAARQGNRLSLRADMLRERCRGVQLRFADIMQADFLTFARSSLQAEAEGVESQLWWPETLLYAADQRTPFEIFARARSRQHLEIVLQLIGLERKEDLGPLLENGAQLPRWQFHRFTPRMLVGFESLGVVP
jgi:hypothetical protein